MSRDEGGKEETAPCAAQAALGPAALSADTHVRVGFRVGRCSKPVFSYKRLKR